jgi:hypothetical protein
MHRESTYSWSHIDIIRDLADVIKPPKYIINTDRNMPGMLIDAGDPKVAVRPSH